MLRYSVDKHRELLKQRLSFVLASSRAAAAGTRETSVDSGQREEWARRLMVSLGSRVHSDRRSDPQQFAELLQAFTRCCDPQELRLVDVAHNAYETLERSRAPEAQRPDSLREYASLLQAHLAHLDEGRMRHHGVDPGTPVLIEPQHAPLRVLVLADNFLGASRVWGRVEREARVRLRMLFCNNARRSPAVFVARLVASLGALLLTGKLRLGMSMLRGRPRVSSLPLADPGTTAWIQANAFDLGLHCMGVIYRPATIECFRLGILNAHIGHLPGMRGRSVLEWSLVHQVTPCVSTFFVDAGIDTGTPIVDRYSPPPAALATAATIAEAKRRLFELDALCYGRAMARLLDGGEGLRNEPAGPRFYAMSELLSSAIVSD